MEIGTGYFAKAKEYADSGYALVSIAKKRPWFLPETLNVTDYFQLAPTDEILSLKDRPKEYESLYNERILSTKSRAHKGSARKPNGFSLGRNRTGQNRY